MLREVMAGAYLRAAGFQSPVCNRAFGGRSGMVNGASCVDQGTGELGPADVQRATASVSIETSFGRRVVEGWWLRRASLH
jgi:hypothetical protein